MLHEGGRKEGQMVLYLLWHGDRQERRTKDGELEVGEEVGAKELITLQRKDLTKLERMRKGDMVGGDWNKENKRAGVLNPSFLPARQDQTFDK